MCSQKKNISNHNYKTNTVAYTQILFETSFNFKSTLLWRQVHGKHAALEDYNWNNIVIGIWCSSVDVWMKWINDFDIVTTRINECVLDEN